LGIITLRTGGGMYDPDDMPAFSSGTGQVALQLLLEYLDRHIIDASGPFVVADSRPRTQDRPLGDTKWFALGHKLLPLPRLTR
jgi:hypothetical protein